MYLEMCLYISGCIIGFRYTVFASISVSKDDVEYNGDSFICLVRQPLKFV